MPKCIYCNVDKSNTEFSLEHIIPQFLGGSSAPEIFKTRQVCKTCNNNLGLFVDASFEKDFLVFNELNQAAYAFFNPDKPSSLPLKCMGTSDLIPPGMNKDEICEYWLGPLGEQILWIRPYDDRFYWYSGGNPRTVKSIETRVYFFCSEHSQLNPMITLLSFKDAFKGRKVKKITCTEILGIDLQSINFSEPDELDIERINYFQQECSENKERKNKLSMNVNYDYRFMAKLALGLSHSFFGTGVENSNYSNELRKALWFKDGGPTPNMRGKSNLGENDNFMKYHLGVPNAVTISIIPTSEGIAINLNINQKMHWVVNCAKFEDVKQLLNDELSDGICVILYKSLNKVIKLSLPQLIAHNQGSLINRSLAEIKTNTIGQKYFENLKNAHHGVSQLEI